MARRTLRLPRLTGRAFAVAVALVLAACGALALAFRASVTDFSADPAALDALPYDVRTDHVLQLELATEDDLEATLAEREAMGVAPADDAADELYLTSAAVENPADYAPVVVTATFTGERKYVYQAFRCAFTVTGVVRGDDAGDALAVGDTIDVFENLRISTPDFNPTGKGQQGDERMVMFGYGDCSVPYREGQEYLLFLEEKDYPEGTQGTEPVYRLIWHPYAAVPTDAPEHPERVWVDETHVIHEGVSTNGNPYSWEEDDDEMTFGEAQRYDRLCHDEEARDAYLEGAATILANTLG